MYPIHPLTIHLPIGLLIAHTILTMLYLYRRDPAFEVSAYHCVWLGWLGTLFAITAGTIDAAQHLFTSAPTQDDALTWINAHAFIGLMILVIYWQVWHMRRRNPSILDDPTQRRAYLARLIVGILLIVLDGWLGGHLVYTLRLGIRT